MHNGTGPAPDSEVDQRWEDVIRNNLQLLLKNCKTTLSELVVRKWGMTPSVLLKQPICADLVSEVRGSPYCDGALRLQHNSEASITQIATRDFGGMGFKCKDCCLHFRDFELPRREWKDDEWTNLAKCHIMASMSRQDRRAWYKCPHCDRLGRNKRMVSARAFLNHLDEHTELQRYQNSLRNRNKTFLS
jgi:hypothetical protein